VNTENAFFSLLFLIGSIFTIVGMITYIFPPKKINSLYGYRTNSSMKTQERWDFAQAYSTKLMILLGVTLAVLSCLGLFVSISETVDYLSGMGLLIAGIVLLFYKTEKAIKTKFPKN
jgi:polyferredoxin